MITQTYYISTGRKNAMYTLRSRRDAFGVGVIPPMFDIDFYVCTLAADEDKAVEKARAYVEAITDRITQSETFKIIFDDYPNHENFKRRGKLSVRDTHSMAIIESGVFPFGKHKDQPIEGAPDSYLLFFADKAKDDNDAVTAALSAACMGVALERGLIAKRDAARAERRAVDIVSQFIGTVGERRDFTGEVIMSFNKVSDWENYWVNKVRVGNDIVSYVGCKSLGAVGQTITFRATIKKHDEYKDIRSTVVSRPA